MEIIPSSYRPITIRSLLDKVFEKVIHRRILDGPLTYAPNKKRNKFIGKQLKITRVILLDIEKAVDSIWHDGLVFKLSNFIAIFHLSAKVH